jgi:hypothetical protein
MNLAETQKLFWNALRGDVEGLDACFAGTPQLPAGERVGIYAQMYVFRQVDALREDFPLLVKKLGDEAFFQLAEKYVLAHPSEDPDLGRLGRRFAGFCPEELRELAALEWARSEVFVEADAASISPEQFAAAVDEDAFAHARVKIIPALRLIGATVVWRAGFEVFDVELAPEEAKALRLALDGEPLGEICGAFGESQAAFAALQSWLAEGWIAATSSPRRAPSPRPA